MDRRTCGKELFREVNDEFKKQTKNTILEYMDRLAVNGAVYSTYLLR